MTFNEILKEFDAGYSGITYPFDSKENQAVEAERKVSKSFLKQSFIKYLQSQQEIVKNIAFGVSPDQRGRKWIELEDLTKLYQAQIKELEG